jgi:hypothetical protein
MSAEINGHQADGPNPRPQTQIVYRGDCYVGNDGPVRLLLIDVDATTQVAIPFDDLAQAQRVGNALSAPSVHLPGPGEMPS